MTPRRGVALAQRWLRAHCPVAVPRCLALAFAAAALAACASLPARPAGGLVAELSGEVAPVSQIALANDFNTAAKRLDVQERAWRVIAEQYYDPRLNGVDWRAIREKYRPRVAAAQTDAQFYLALKAMVRELKDSHTRVVTPRESADHRRFTALGFGAALSVIDDQLLVVDVEPDSPAARSGLARGDVVLAIDGHRFDATFLKAARNLPLTGEDILSPEAEPANADEAARFAQVRAVRRVLQRAPDEPPHPQRLLIERTSGTVELVVQQEPLAQPPRVVTSALPSGVAVLRLNRFSSRNREDLERAMQRLAWSRALIVDLRGNAGGDYSQFIFLLRHFLPEPRVVLTQLKRDGDGIDERTVEVEPVDKPYLKPIAVLTDRRSGSAAELAAVTLLEQRDALVVGESTCGCVVGVSWEYVLPGGGGVRVSETGFRSARGRKMEGEPLAPAIYVPPGVADLRAGRDRALEAAERALLQRAL